MDCQSRGAPHQYIQAQMVELVRRVFEYQSAPQVGRLNGRLRTFQRAGKID
jgi:hypothetical protein